MIYVLDTAKYLNIVPKAFNLVYDLLLHYFHCQIHSFLVIWSHLLKKHLMENIIFVQCLWIFLFKVSAKMRSLYIKFPLVLFLILTLGLSR